MELGIYHEFPVLPGHSQAECFAAGFDIVDASEEYGLDVMWLPEPQFAQRGAPPAPPPRPGSAAGAPRWHPAPNESGSGPAYRCFRWRTRFASPRKPRPWTTSPRAD